MIDIFFRTPNTRTRSTSKRIFSFRNFRRPKIGNRFCEQTNKHYPSVIFSMPLLICWIEDCRTTCKSYHIVVHSVSLCIFCQERLCESDRVKSTSFNFFFLAREKKK